jgi:dephospho-CoA kinase
MRLVGIAGTDGSGKDTVTEVLTERDWLYVSLSEILREEAKNRGLKLRRYTLRLISAEWRRKHGLGVLIDKAMELYKPQQKKYKGLVIASLRNPGEADEVHRLGGQVVWVDAAPKVRYGRIMNRHRGTEDDVTYEEFLAEEEAQMRHHDGDEATLNLGDVKAKADIFLENNGDDIEAFKNQVEKTLQQVLGS